MKGIPKHSLLVKVFFGVCSSSVVVIQPERDASRRTPKAEITESKNHFFFLRGSLPLILQGSFLGRKLKKLLFSKTRRFCLMVTLPKTNSSPPKMDGMEDEISFRDKLFSGATTVSLQGGCFCVSKTKNPPKNPSRIPAVASKLCR